MINVFKLLPVGDWLWIGACAALVGYHVVTLERAKIETRAEVNAQWQVTIAEGNAKAKADHDAQQARIDQLAAASQPELAKKFDSIKAQLAKLTDQAKKPPVVFKPDCVLPSDQVAAYNAIK